MELKEGDLNSSSHMPFGLVSTKAVSGVVEVGSSNDKCEKGGNEDSEEGVLLMVSVSGIRRDKNKGRRR